MYFHTVFSVIHVLKINSPTKLAQIVSFKNGFGPFGPNYLTVIKYFKLYSPQRQRKSATRLRFRVKEALLPSNQVILFDNTFVLSLQHD